MHFTLIDVDDELLNFENLKVLIVQQFSIFSKEKNAMKIDWKMTKTESTLFKQKRSKTNFQFSERIILLIFRSYGIFLKFI